MELLSYEFDNRQSANKSIENSNDEDLKVPRLLHTDSLFSKSTIAFEAESNKEKRVLFEQHINIVRIDSFKAYNKKQSFIEDYKPTTQEPKCICILV